jgi:hypothetical protein
MHEQRNEEHHWFNCGVVEQVDVIRKVMIHYHLNIQLFTTLSMWQGGPPLHFEFIFFLKKIK